MKRDLVYALIVIVAVAGICFGLAQMRPNFTPRASQPYSLDEKVATATTPAAAVAPAPGKVVMHVNGEPVTDEEFQTFVNGMPENMQQVAQMPAGRRALAEQIANLIALAQEGRKMGLDTDKDTNLRLGAERTNLLAMAALRKMVSSNEGAMRAEFEKQKGNYDTIDLKHILIAYEGGQVPPRGGANPPPLSAALDKASQIEAELKRGADFAMMAKSQSDDVASAQQGGELGPVPRQSLPPEVAAAVFVLKPGEVSAPLRTQFGVHIFKAGERKAPSFEQMKPQLEAEMQQKMAKETVERVKKTTKVDLDPTFFGPVDQTKPQMQPARPKNPS